MARTLIALLIFALSLSSAFPQIPVAGTGGGTGPGFITTNIQYGGTPVTGTGGTSPIHSYTIPANTIPPNGCMQFTSISKHTTGTASVTYGINIGSVAQSAGASTSAVVNNFTFDLCNTGSTAAGTQMWFVEVDVAGGGAVNLTGNTGVSIASTSPILVTTTMTVAATDVVTPFLFKAVLIQ